MQHFGISAVFNLPGDAVQQPEGHDDTRAATAAGAAARAARPGLLARLWPLNLRAAAERRHADRMRDAELARLAATSPHLLADVGMAPRPVPLRVTDHNAHLADDIAISAEDVMTVHTVSPDPGRTGRADDRRARGVAVE